MLYSGRELIRKGILPLGDLWFVYYNPYWEPASIWPDVKVPALVLYGGQDTTVPTKTSLEIVPSLLTNSSSRVVVFPNRSHALGGPSRNDDPAYISLVTEWIFSVTNHTQLPTLPYGNELTDTGNAHWYGIGSQKTYWYNTIHFHLALVIFFLFAFLGAIVSSLFIKTRPLHRTTLALIGIVNLVVLVSWALVVNYLLNADAESSLPVIPMSNILPWLTSLSVLLAIGLTYLFVKENRKGALSGTSKYVLGVIVFAMLLFIPFMGYWNLLGGRL